MRPELVVYSLLTLALPGRPLSSFPFPLLRRLPSFPESDTLNIPLTLRLRIRTVQALAQFDPTCLPTISIKSFSDGAPPRPIVVLHALPPLHLKNRPYADANEVIVTGTFDQASLPVLSSSFFLYLFRSCLR